MCVRNCFLDKDCFDGATEDYPTDDMCKNTDDFIILFIRVEVDSLNLTYEQIICLGCGKVFLG